MYKKTILCLANSWKTGGTCIAGKELIGTATGGWVRPISGRPTHEISLAERKLPDGTSADVLHVLELPLEAHHPSLHQSENHLIDPTQPWQKAGIVTWQQLQASVDRVPEELWLNGYSTQYGENDKVPQSLLAAIPDSLKLVKVEDLILHVALEPGYQGGPATRKVRGSFTLTGRAYRLAVTDPVLSATYLHKSNGDYPMGTALLCISLSEPKYSHAFKLIAAVFTAYRCRRA